MAERVIITMQRIVVKILSGYIEIDKNTYSYLSRCLVISTGGGRYFNLFCDYNDVDKIK